MTINNAGKPRSVLLPAHAPNAYTAPTAAPTAARIPRNRARRSRAAISSERKSIQKLMNRYASPYTRIGLSSAKKYRATRAAGASKDDANEVEKLKTDLLKCMD